MFALSIVNLCLWVLNLVFAIQWMKASKLGGNLDAHSAYQLLVIADIVIVCYCIGDIIRTIPK